MRLSAVLLVCSLAGAVLGAALIARWAVGCAIIADSAAVAWFAWNRDDGVAEPQARVLQGVPRTVHDVLEKARIAP